MMISASRHAMRVAAALLCCFTTTACTGGQDYESVQISVSETWQALTGTTPEIAVDAQARDPQWWAVFHDDTLNTLVDAALLNSHTLAAAQARLAAAEAEAGLAGANRLPQLDGTAGITRSSDDVGQDTVKRAGLQGSWDIDPAGINRRRQKAAIAAAEAARADRDRVRIDIIADIATTYIRLRTSQKQLDYARRNLRAQQDTLRVVRGQREEGVIGDFDVARTTSQAETTRSRIPQLETVLTATINRLNVLCGNQPGTLDHLVIEPKPIPTVPSKTVIAMPVAVIAQRPDIQGAERRLAEAAELKQAASLEIYPTLSLSAFFGFEDSRIAGSFNPWSIAAGTVAPILNFGRIEARINAASAREAQAFHDYRQTTIAAMAEVEDALTAYMNEQKRAAALGIAAREQGRAAKIVGEQFRGGEADQTGLLIAERDRLDADLALAGSQGQTAENLVRLYRALGWGASASDQDMHNLQSRVIEGKPARGKMQPIID